MRTSWLFVALAAALYAAPASADVWDLQGDNDDSPGTDNELVHGTNQQHDLGVRPGPVADQDWYLMPQKRQASYEVIVDGVSGDLGFSGFALERVQVAGTTTTALETGQAAVTGSSGYTRALRWANTTSTTVTDQFVRVSGGFCGTSCSSNDVYAIHVRETTVNIARFNASGSQATILLTQNASERPINATFFYWSSTGTLLQTGSLVAFPSKQLNVFNVATFPALAGQSGHITVAHDGGYGGLVIKTVALEPATGFSFDTPGVYVPN
jgi:hypothetical protein